MREPSTDDTKTDGRRGRDGPRLCEKSDGCYDSFFESTVGSALDAVADRGYYASEEIRACEEAGITVTLPKPMTSNAKAAGRFGKQDFVYIAADDVYICPARMAIIGVTGLLEALAT